MRCTSVEELLPLYVEGDLSEREALEVAAHLSSCEGCGQLEKEFRGSQERLHKHAAPEFDEEFYRSIRRTVLAEINASGRTRPQSFLNIFAAPFGLRQALAGSLLLLIFFAGVAGLLYKLPSTGGSDRAALAIEKSFRELNPSAYDAPPRRESAGALTGTGAPGRASAAQSIPAVLSAARRVTGPGRRAAGAASEGVARQGNAGAASALTAEARNESQNKGAPSQPDAVARMEIQTSDPNIRIIWLARKSSE